VIAKFLATPSFGAATRYVLDRDPDLRHAGARPIAGNMAGRDAAELTREFEATAARNPRVRNTVAHIVIRTAPADRPLGDREWARIAREHLARLGYTDTPYLVVKHPEPDQHVHVVASRVRFDGSHVKDGWERTRSRAVVRALEREYGLERTEPRRHERETEREDGRGRERLRREG
jgi:hypothetical protein